MLRYFIHRPLHASWMVACACAGIVIGVLLSGNVAAFISIAWLLTGTALSLMAMLKGRIWMIPVAVAGGLFIGLWRGSMVRVELGDYERIIGRTVMISGVVSDDADKNQQGKTVLRLRDIHMGSEAMSGVLWVTTNDTSSIRRSDSVVISGKVADGFGSFAASIYSAQIRSVERPVPGDIALQARDYFALGVRTALSNTEASLGLGYLVGQRRGLPPELDESLQVAGLTHIVVASGYNLTILVRLARRLFEKISKYLSLLCSGTMIVGFIAVTGLSPSMSRAGLIAGLSLLAWYYGRRIHPLVLLPVAMAVTLIVQPSYAWGDLGWQLSFTAFAGVMILAPLLQAYFFGDKRERVLRRIFIETIAATIATLPILLVAFGQFSVISPIANMLILPLVPVAMLLTFVAGIGGLIAPGAAEVVGFPAQLVLSYMTSSVGLMGNISWAIQEVKFSVVAAAGAYGVVVAACMYMSWKTKYDLRRSSLVE